MRADLSSSVGGDWSVVCVTIQIKSYDQFLHSASCGVPCITVQAVLIAVLSVEVQASYHSASCGSTDSVEVRASFTVLCCVSFVL